MLVFTSFSRLLQFIRMHVETTARISVSVMKLGFFGLIYSDFSLLIFHLVTFIFMTTRRFTMLTDTFRSHS